MSKVSVIVPAYNAEAYIEQCISSILRQTLTDIELIVIDDGSTDQTGAILDRMARGQTNMTVIHQENRGLYAARKAGLALATGEYVGWVDADDFAEPDMFRQLYDAARAGDSEMAYCDYNWYPCKTKTKEKWFRLYQGKRDVDFVERNSQPWNKIVKRSLLERLQVGDYFESCFDEIYITVLLEARNPVAVRQALYNYRVGEDTMSAAYTNTEHYERFISASESLAWRMKAQTESDPYWKSYFEYRVIYYRLMTMIVSANAGDRSTYQKVRRDLMAMRPRYSRNQHFSPILTQNYGKLKAFVIGRVVPLGYGAARLACLAGMR